MSALSAEAGPAHSSSWPQHPGPPVPLPFPLGMAPHSPCSDLNFLSDLTSSSYLGHPGGKGLAKGQPSDEGPAQLTCVPPTSQKGPCWAGWGMG